MKRLLVVSVWIFAFIIYVFAQNTRFTERYSWRSLNFHFPDERSRQSAINARDYIPINNVPLGTEIWRDRFFITVPRWLTGIGSTLNYFRIDSSGGNTGRNNNSPTLIPYPNYEVNRITANETSYVNKIVSVFRLKVDACDRLWFVDTGLIDIIGAYNQVIAPRLFIFDLRTDRLIRQYTFNSSDTSDGTVFGGNMVVDVTANTCDQAYAYIPDFGGYRLVVYSYAENRSWRIRHPYFYFDPFASPFYVGGLVFLWVDGIFGATLSAIQSDGFRTFYFTAISSNYQYAVNTRFLRDRNIATNTTTLLEAYRFLGTRGPNMQTTAHMLDERTGTIFYTLPNRNGIGCWNSIRNANSYTPQTNAILATDDNTMIFPNDIIFDDADNVWLLSDRLPVSNMRGLSENEVNFRLFSARISDAIRGTVCEPTRGGNNGGFGGGNFGSTDDNISMSNRFGSGSSSNKDDSINFPEKKYETLNQILKSGGNSYGSPKEKRPVTGGSLKRT